MLIFIVHIIVSSQIKYSSNHMWRWGARAFFITSP